MVSWKYSFDEISKDLELAKKKKQALEDLYNAGKISESTFGSLDSDITATIAEIENRQKAMAEKLTSKITDLEQQINTLELFLANSEIQYVAGEIDGELHERESRAFSLGLDVLRQQLDSVKGVVRDIMPEAVTPASPVEPEEAIEPEAPTIEEETETQVEQPLEEAPIEVPQEVEKTVEEATVDQPMEAPEEVETVPEDVTVEQASEIAVETPAQEALVQEGLETSPETPTEEIEKPVASPENTVDEPQTTHEVAVEEVEAAATEEDTETATEEDTPYEEEEVVEEETEW